MTDTTQQQRISSFSPRLVVADAARAIAFYRAAFGAEEVVRYADSQGKIVYAEIRIGKFTVGIKDEGDGDPAPTSLGGSPVIMDLEVSDADVVATAMIEAGATVIFPVEDQPYGQRGGRLADPFGHLWAIGQWIEDLTPEEIQRRTETIYHRSASRP